MLIKDVDYIELFDGRKGTIVHVYADGKAYEFEPSGSNGDTETITADMVKRVIETYT